MPYITDKEKLDSPFLDKRVKLLPCQKEMIAYWYREGHSMRSLARMFKVDKRLIGFVIYPERLKRNLELRQDRGGSKIYYEREKHSAAMQAHRSRKYDVLKDATIQKRAKAK